jgi:hypothetical protein
VVYITTEKESICTTKTYDMIKNLICKMNDQDKIYLMNYPGKNGVMAHQLNYAVNKISEKKNRENSYYKVQNLKDGNKKLYTANYPLHLRMCCHAALQN